jgi:pyruvate-formate lyase-activating enzyme
MWQPSLYITEALRKFIRPRTYFCDQLWTTVNIRINGDVEACACAPTKGPTFPLFSEPIEKLLNNEWFTGTRRYLLSEMNLPVAAPDGERGCVFECCVNCPVSLQDRYYINIMRLRLTEPGLIRTRHLKPAPASLLREKHANYKRMLALLRRPVTNIGAFPIFAHIDPSNVCNLRCPFCLVGAGKLEQELRGLMPFELFERLMERIGPYLIGLELYRYGEPMLNPDIVKMIRLAAQEYRIFCSISTNFSMPLSDETLHDLVESGLSKLIIAADDVEQPFYEKYRRGGGIQMVLGNLERLIRFRQSVKSVYPRIVWQNLIFRFNEKRLKIIKSTVKKLGVDVFRVATPYIPAHEDYADWIPQSAFERGKASKHPVMITDVTISPLKLYPAQEFHLRCRVRNALGRETWRAEHGDDGSIRVGVKLLDSFEKLKYEMGRIHLPKPLAPGEEITLETTLTAPDAAGSYFLKLSMVKENHYWFEYNPRIQEKPAVIALRVRRAGEG